MMRKRQNAGCTAGKFDNKKNNKRIRCSRVRLKYLYRIIFFC